MGSYPPTKARLPPEVWSNSLAFMACKQGLQDFLPHELEVYMATARPGVGVSVSGGILTSGRRVLLTGSAGECLAALI